jgi:hypothetical protein
VAAGPLPASDAPRYTECNRVAIPIVERTINGTDAT